MSEEKFLVTVAGEGYEFTLQAAGVKAKIIEAIEGFYAGATVTAVSFGEPVDMSGR